MFSSQQISAIDRATEKVVADYPPPKYRLNVSPDEIVILDTETPYTKELIDVYCIYCEAYQIADGCDCNEDEE